MRHEQQRWVFASLLAEPPIVECRQHRLAGARCRDDQIAMAIVAVALELQPVEHPLLVAEWMHVQAGEGDGRARWFALRAQRPIEVIAPRGGVVVLEVLRRPRGRHVGVAAICG